MLEAELQAQEPLYQGVLVRGQDLQSKQNQVSQKAVQKWMRTLKKQWSQLTVEVTGRLDRLQAAASIKQVKEELPLNGQVFTSSFCFQLLFTVIVLR